MWTFVLSLPHKNCSFLSNSLIILVFVTNNQKSEKSHATAFLTLRPFYVWVSNWTQAFWNVFSYGGTQSTEIPVLDFYEIYG